MEVDDIQSQFTKFRRIGNNGGGRSSSDSSGKITNIGGGTQKGQVKLDELEEEAGVVHPTDEEEQEARRAPVKRSGGGGGMTMDMVVGGGGRLCGWPSSRIVRVSRASGGKDRHSKVLTSKGLRDRRVRLSVSTAIQFYDLQDRLGYEQPSKAVEWLLKAASSSINELPSLDASFSNKNDFKSGDAELDLDLDDLTTTTTNYNHHCHQPQQQSRKCSSTSETSKGSGGLSLSRSEIRIKARERARERTAVDKEKGKDSIIIVNNDESTRATATATATDNNNNNDDYNDKGDDVMNQSHHHRSHVNLGVSRNAASFTDLLTGGMSISRRVSNNNNNNNGTSSTPEINSPTDYEFFAVPASSSGAGAETSQQQIRPMAGRLSVPAEYQHQQNHGHHHRHHPELHHFSFLQENFFHPVVTAGETNYNLNFSISSGAGLAGFNRGTLQSNLVPSSLLPHVHQRLIPSIVDGASNLPFLVGATTASAAVSSNDPDHPFPDSYDARLQLCYGDSVTAAADHHKGKGKS